MARHEDFPDFDLRNLLGDYLALEEISGLLECGRAPDPANSFSYGLTPLYQRFSDHLGM
jgi:hypothetical protein